MTTSKIPTPEPQDTEAWLTALLPSPEDEIAATRQAPSAVATVPAFWRSLPAGLRQPRGADPFSQAVLGAYHADRVSFATVCGHQAATRRLRPELPPGDLVAFCASEEGGAHPRAIHTSLVPSGDGYVLTGQKRWATLAPVADCLLVIASVGQDAGRNRLRLVQLPADRDGITIRAMPPTSFTPEIPHAEIDFERVAVAADEVADGDAYIEAVKPFRLIEDTLIACALLSLNLRLALDNGWPEEVCEDLLALLVAGEALFRLDPSRPASHLAAAGWSRIRHHRLSQHAQRELWHLVPEAQREAWQRDTGKSVAARARELRRQAAWRHFGRRVGDASAQL
jgi:hypothetical protein